jgi:hypothetical protein
MPGVNSIVEAADEGEEFFRSKVVSEAFANSLSELRLFWVAGFLGRSGFLLASQAIEKSAFFEGSLEITSASIDLVKI